MLYTFKTDNKSFIKSRMRFNNLFPGTANQESGCAAADGSQRSSGSGDGDGCDGIGAKCQQEPVSRGSFRQVVSRLDLQWDH